jgi:uncharacterized OsmC-like protein
MEYQMDFKLHDLKLLVDFTFGQLEIAGDENLGFRPYQLFAASVTGCSGLVLRKILEKQRQKVKDIRVQTRVVRSGGDVHKIEKIHLHFLITGENLNEDKVRKAVELDHKHCSMVQSIARSIEVTESFEIIAERHEAFA